MFAVHIQDYKAGEELVKNWQRTGKYPRIQQYGGFETQQDYFIFVE